MLGLFRCPRYHRQPLQNAPVAQMDRVPPSEGGSRTFESCRAHHPPSCMDFSAYVADIRSRFPSRDFLLVDDIAVILSKSPKAVRSLIDRGNLPPARKRGGRLGCTVGEMAEYLMNCNETHGRKKAPAARSSGFILRPRADRTSLAAAIAAARVQSDFAEALANALEAISLRGGIDPLPKDEKSL